MSMGIVLKMVPENKPMQIWASKIKELSSLSGEENTRTRTENNEEEQRPLV